METQPILSIVIPTKNRYFYLKELLLAFNSNSFNSKAIEIIVQDNSDDNTEFLNFLSQIENNHIKYFYTEGWLSVCDNCDLGIKNASGEYISMIGDDDGFLPSIINVVSYMKSNHIDAVVSPKPHYIWPDVAHKVWGDENSGVVTFKKYSNTIKEINVKQILEKIVYKGGVAIMNLPRVYHMVIKSDCLQKLYQECRTYFPGPSPDMANAVGLSKFINKSVYIDTPIIITGNGYESTGGQGVRHEHHGKIEDKSFLPKGTKEKWDKNIPLFWSGATIYAESVSKAIEATKLGNQKIKLNYLYLYAHLLIFEPRYYVEIFTSMKKFIGKDFKDVFVVIFYCHIVLSMRGFVFIKNLAKNIFKIRLNTIEAKNIKSIYDCINYFEEFHKNQYFRA